MPIARIRRRSQSSLKPTRIGQVDYVCLTPGAKSRSLLSEPIGVFADVGLGTEDVSIDYNNGPKGPYMVGGPLFLSKLQRPVSMVGGSTVMTGPGRLPAGASTHNGFSDGSDWRARYSGGFVLSTTYSSIWTAEKAIEESQYVSGLNDNNLSTLGSRGYNALRPKVATAGVFQTIAEAKDVPRTILSSMRGAADLWSSICRRPDLMPRYAAEQQLRSWKRAPGRASDHFVNHQFGWVPLVKDVTDLCSTIINFDDTVAKIRDRNGRWVKRRFHEDVDQREEVLFSVTGSTSFCTPSLGDAYIVPNSARLDCVRVHSTRVWYEGSFRQYYPEFDASLMSGHPALEKVAQAIRIAGAEVNPVNVYKVLPWSWAVDWFVNVGDQIQVLQDMATDAVVSRYFYLMRHTVRRVEYRVRFSTLDGQHISFTALAGYDIKRRVPGHNAFGFTALPTGLSARRLAILGALGISGGTRKATGSWKPI